MHSRQTASTDISGSAAGLVCEPRECDKSSRDLSHIDIEALKRSIVCKCIILSARGVVYLIVDLAKISERTRLNRQQLFVDAYQRGDATLAVAEVINTRTHGVVDMVNVEGDLVQALLRLHERVVARRQ